MRTIAVILLSCLVPCVSAQVLTTKRSVKTIIQQRSIYLNGGARSSVGGKSRINIKIDLPPNTVSWYYEFTTQPGEGGTATLNLALQLSSLMADPSGLTKAVTSQINVPPGSASADVYLLDQKSVDLFMQKADLNSGSYFYNREGSVLNTRQGVIEIDDINEYRSLGRIHSCHNRNTPVERSEGDLQGGDRRFETYMDRFPSQADANDILDI